MGSRFYSPREIAKLVDGPGLLTRIDTNDSINAWIIVEK
jgi:hypothetical protein